MRLDYEILPKSRARIELTKTHTWFSAANAVKQQSFGQIAWDLWLFYFIWQFF